MEGKIKMIKRTSRNRTLYRLRGTSPYTGQDVFITNCWYDNLRDANVILRNYKTDKRWKRVRLITIKEQTYHKKYQNIPKIC